ncbi:MAG: hypothetical protein R3C18_23195 [Planctomycetaceae bacterium]
MSRFLILTLATITITSTAHAEELKRVRIYNDQETYEIRMRDYDPVEYQRLKSGLQELEEHTRRELQSANAVGDAAAAQEVVSDFKVLRELIVNDYKARYPLTKVTVYGGAGKSDLRREIAKMKTDPSRRGGHWHLWIDNGQIFYTTTSPGTYDKSLVVPRDFLNQIPINSDYLNPPSLGGALGP